MGYYMDPIATEKIMKKYYSQVELIPGNMRIDQHKKNLM